MIALNQILRLPDGRFLGYDELGRVGGQPVLYFHGTPSARVEWRLFDADVLANKLGLRLIVPDRPGVGLSTFQRGRLILDWPSDVVALADHLQLVTFAVVGYSGGGPYAAACALRIPERVAGAAVASGVAPYDVPGLVDGINPSSRGFNLLAHDRPWLSKLALAFLNMSARAAPGRLVAQAMSGLPEPDRVVLQRPDVQAAFIAMVRETQRAGARGAQADTALMASPWGFRPQDIRLPVHLWHGERDMTAPLPMARYLASVIPHARAHFVPREGHLSLIANYAEQILMSAASQTTSISTSRVEEPPVL